jgi:hypothetical protein
MLSRDRELEAIEERIRSRQRSPEEVAKLSAGKASFDYQEWVRENSPATPEELAETEDFLRELNAEREAILAREAESKRLE